MDASMTLARELRKHPRGPGKRYPKELVEQVRAHVVARRARGESLESVAAELGLVPDTVRRWAAASAADLVPVTVVEEATSHTMTLVSPSGYRVEGLGLHDAAALLRALA